MYPFIPNTMFYSPWQAHPNPRDQLTQQCNVSNSDFVTRQMAAKCCTITGHYAPEILEATTLGNPVETRYIVSGRGPDGMMLPDLVFPKPYSWEKPTIFDLYNAIFPVDPIRDYIAERIKAIEDKYKRVMQTLDRMGA